MKSRENSLLLHWGSKNGYILINDLPYLHYLKMFARFQSMECNSLKVKLLNDVTQFWLFPKISMPRVQNQNGFMRRRRTERQTGDLFLRTVRVTRHWENMKVAVQYTCTLQHFLSLRSRPKKHKMWKNLVSIFLPFSAHLTNADFCN